MPGFETRSGFLITAALFEFALVLAALGVGWMVGVDPLEPLVWKWPAAAWGVAGAVPLFALFVLSMHVRLASLSRIKELLVNLLGPPLAACRWYELAVLALFVGFAEELLFRGLLQRWFEPALGWGGALAASNVIFGLAHSLTPAYGLLAALTGVYLGWLLDAGGERNLLVPSLTHGVYDFLAFVVIARAYLAKTPAEDDKMTV